MGNRELDRRSFLGLTLSGALAATVRAAPASAAAGEIVRMDALALAGLIRARKLSCVEAMTAYLDHIEKLNPAVNAIVALQERGALIEQARAGDEALRRGDAVGPLHGLPHAVKDLAPVKGIRTTFGSPIFKDFVPEADSLMVARLRRAGAIFIGKTNSPEFGFGSHTFNPVYGTTRNAYDQKVSAGGSSGGAGVGLALRMLPLADGSDYGGSLRNPAGWNNVYGFRPSIGVVPNDGKEQWLPSMGVSGPMARNPADLALLLSVQAGYDRKVPLSADAPAWPARLDRDFKGARIAWLGDFKGSAPTEPEVISVCRAALKSFETIGCVVEDAVPDYSADAVWQAFIQLRGWQQGGNMLAHYKDPAKRALLKPEAIWEIETGLKLSAFDISAASQLRSDWYRAVDRLFEHYDFLLAPTAQLFPFDAEWRWPKEVAGTGMATYHEWMKGVCLITMSGCPSLAAPAGFSAAGLPIGLQIIAPNRQELAALQLAHAYHKETRWSEKRLSPLLA